jgi:hypothetical protein
VQVAASAPHAVWKLIAFSPHVSELLAIMTLSEVARSFVRLYPHRNMTEACQLEYFLGLLFHIESNKERGRGTLAEF